MAENKSSDALLKMINGVNSTGDNPEEERKADVESAAAVAALEEFFVKQGSEFMGLLNHCLLETENMKSTIDYLLQKVAKLEQAMNVESKNRKAESEDFLVH